MLTSEFCKRPLTLPELITSLFCVVKFFNCVVEDQRYVSQGVARRNFTERSASTCIILNSKNRTPWKVRVRRHLGLQYLLQCCQYATISVIPTTFGRLCFIECVVHKDDCSKELLEWGSRVATANSRPPAPWELSLDRQGCEPRTANITVEAWSNTKNLRHDFLRTR